MTSTLPIPVRFDLPSDLWEPVPPESLGVENAAFLAVRRGAEGDFTPTLSIAGDWRTDDATLEEIADESLAVLRGQGATEVELVKRREIESDHAPAITQALGAMAVYDGRTLDLRQAQVVQGIVDVHDPQKRVVVTYTLTCTFKQFDEMVPEFQQFMATVEIVAADDGTAG